MLARVAGSVAGSNAVAGVVLHQLAVYFDPGDPLPRFSPGFEAHVSKGSMFLIYAGLAVGLAAGARLRGLYRHQVENRDERDERRNPERRPHAVVTPE